MHNIDIREIIKIAKEAGEIVMQFYDKEYSIEEKENKTPVTEADIKTNEFLLEKLSEFNHSILSEESQDNFEDRKDADCVWIIDPLDGTADFIGKTGEFAIMIGLIDNKSGESILGVVYAPALDELYFAQKSHGAFIIKDSKESKLKVSNKELQNGTILVSRNHLGDYEQEVAKKYNMTQISMGSAGLKICRIARGDGELYINSGNQSGLWDICAGDIILKEAGGEIKDLNNKRILYNQKNIILENGYEALGN